MQMELYQIRQFVAVAETGSFTKAAVRAAVSQPALSASVAKLELELGVKLLNRTPKSVTPTAAGRRFFDTARQVLAACNKIKADLRATAGDRAFRIGVLRTLPTAHLAQLIEAFRRAMPGTAIELLDGTRDDLASQLASRKLAAAITSAGELREGLRTVALLRERYALLVGLHHRFAATESVSLDDLQGEPFIVRSQCETFAATTQILADRGIRTHVVYKTDQDDRALALIGAGLGIALMPELYGSAEVRAVRVRDFHAERVIELQWNDDATDDRLDTLVAFASSHNWRARSADLAA